ncbi:MAG: CZB domain-containing protein [Sideroxydans sp.]|nr:CZB domain-containing protein [Sideroxydans sp.]
MGLFDWFSALSKGEEAAVAVHTPQLGGIKENSQIQGLDFVAAIEAHRKWRARLAEYADGTSKETLDHSVICRDDQCALGKWLYSEGQTFTGHLPLFHQIKAKHAQFHISAAQIVEMIDTDRKEEAVNNLLDGEFSKNSRDVQTLLSQLYMLINQHTAT